jgi:hypothetical protein
MSLDDDRTRQVACRAADIADILSPIARRSTIAARWWAACASSVPSVRRSAPATPSMGARYRRTGTDSNSHWFRRDYPHVQYHGESTFPDFKMAT